MSERIQQDALRHASATIDRLLADDPEARAALRGQPEALEVGIRAGMAGTLLALVEHGILPGAFEDAE
jgi:hypothetical protein